MKLRLNKPTTAALCRSHNRHKIASHTGSLLTTVRGGALAVSQAFVFYHTSAPAQAAELPTDGGIPTSYDSSLPDSSGSDEGSIPDNDLLSGADTPQARVYQEPFLSIIGGDVPYHGMTINSGDTWEYGTVRILETRGIHVRSTGVEGALTIDNLQVLDSHETTSGTVAAINWREVIMLMDTNGFFTIGNVTTVGAPDLSAGGAMTLNLWTSNVPAYGSQRHYTLQSLTNFDGTINHRANGYGEFIIGHGDNGSSWSTFKQDTGFNVRIISDREIEFVDDNRYEIGSDASISFGATFAAATSDLDRVGAGDLHFDALRYHMYDHTDYTTVLKSDVGGGAFTITTLTTAEDHNGNAAKMHFKGSNYTGSEKNTGFAIGTINGGSDLIFSGEGNALSTFTMGADMTIGSRDYYVEAQDLAHVQIQDIDDFRHATHFTIKRGGKITFQENTAIDTLDASIQLGGGGTIGFGDDTAFTSTGLIISESNSLNKAGIALGDKSYITFNNFSAFGCGAYTEAWESLGDASLILKGITGYDGTLAFRSAANQNLRISGTITDSTMLIQHYYGTDHDVVVHTNGMVNLENERLVIAGVLNVNDNFNRLDASSLTTRKLALAAGVTFTTHSTGVSNLGELAVAGTQSHYSTIRAQSGASGDVAFSVSSITGGGYLSFANASSHAVNFNIEDNVSVDLNTLRLANDVSVTLKNATAAMDVDHFIVWDRSNLIFDRSINNLTGLREMSLYRQADLTIDAISTTSGATGWDLGFALGTVTISGTAGAGADLVFNNSGTSGFIFEKLMGAGNINVGNGSGWNFLRLNSISGYEGTITTAGDSEIGLQGTINSAADVVLNFTGSGQAKVLDNLTLSDHNTSFDVNGTLVLSANKVITRTYSSTVNIDTFRMENNSTYRSVVNGSSHLGHVQIAGGNKAFIEAADGITGNITLTADSYAGTGGNMGGILVFGKQDNAETGYANFSINHAATVNMNEIQVEKYTQLSVANAASSMTVNSYTVWTQGRLVFDRSGANMTGSQSLTLDGGASFVLHGTSHSDLVQFGSLNVMPTIDTSLESIIRLTDGRSVSFGVLQGEGLIDATSASAGSYLELKGIDDYKGTIDLGSAGDLRLRGDVSLSQRADDATINNADGASVSTSAALQVSGKGDFSITGTLSMGHDVSKSGAGAMSVKRLLITGSSELNVAAGSTVQVQGLLSSTHEHNQLEKTGSGTLQLENLDVDVNLIVTSGTVKFVNDSVINVSPAVTSNSRTSVGSGGTLDLTKAVSHNGEISMQVGATAILDTANAAVNLEGNTLTLSSTGLVNLDLQNLDLDAFRATGKLVLFSNASGLMTELGEMDFTHIDSFGNEAVIASEYLSVSTYTLSKAMLSYDAVSGDIYLSGFITMPEPSTTAMSLLALSGLLVRRRRRQ